MNICYSVKDASKILDVHTRTIYRLIESGKLKAFNVGVGEKPSWKIHDTAIQQLITESYFEKQEKLKIDVNKNINDIDIHTRQLLKENILSKVKIDNNNCWLYPIKREGYGSISFKINGITRSTSVHRIAYLIWKGDIKKLILHICNVKNCCNPDHLYEGNHSDNMHDHHLNCERKKNLREKNKINNPPPTIKQEFFSLDEVSEFTGISVENIKTFIKEGKIRFLRLNGVRSALRIHESEILRLKAETFKKEED